MSAPPPPVTPPTPSTPPTPPPAPRYPLIARASTTVRWKNLAIVVMCLLFCAMFVYDGWIGYPRADDRLVDYMKGKVESHTLAGSYLPTLTAWPGWSQASIDQKNAMTAIAQGDAQVDGWHSPQDIATQQYVAYGLLVAVAASLWWFFHCQARRVIADDATLSPAPGVVFPWSAITVVDNTRWKSSGIVTLTYKAAGGGTRTAKLDDYETTREKLLPILELLADKAAQAEFIPKEDVPPEPAASA